MPGVHARRGSPPAPPQPTYEEVCRRTGHTEVVLVIYDPKQVTYDQLLAVFWESHDPTQGMRQGNDAGTQYRSGIYTFDDAQAKAAEASKLAFQPHLAKAGYGPITTEILPAPEFYYAEDYHQQYLGKNPQGYCGLGGTACRARSASRALIGRRYNKGENRPRGRLPGR